MTTPAVSGVRVTTDFLAAISPFSHFGFLALAGVVFGILIGGTAIDLYLTVRKRRTVGYYANQFFLAYPWISALIALVVGAMIAHFFLNLADG